jgi:hypothetical protein
MTENIREFSFESRFRRIRKLEDSGLNMLRKLLKIEYCGQEYGRDICEYCTFKNSCEERTTEVTHKIWQIQSKALQSYRNLEKDIRRSIEERGETARLRECLAFVLRRIAGSEVYVSDGDAAMIEEAEQIFDDLFNQSGENRFREEAESCRMMRNRIEAE